MKSRFRFGEEELVMASRFPSEEEDEENRPQRTSGSRGPAPALLPAREDDDDQYLDVPLVVLTLCRAPPTMLPRHRLAQRDIILNTFPHVLAYLSITYQPKIAEILRYLPREVLELLLGDHYWED